MCMQQRGVENSFMASRSGHRRCAEGAGCQASILRSSVVACCSVHTCLAWEGPLGYDFVVVGGHSIPACCPSASVHSLGPCWRITRRVLWDEDVSMAVHTPPPSHHAPPFHIPLLDSYFRSCVLFNFTLISLHCSSSLSLTVRNKGTYNLSLYTCMISDCTQQRYLCPVLPFESVLRVKHDTLPADKGSKIKEEDKVRGQGTKGKN